MSTPAAEEGEGEAAGPQYEFVETDAGKLRYAKRGSGPEQIVLVHGFGGDLDNWLFNIDALAENATVYALDLPGHGQSTKSLKDASLAGLSQALVAFLEKLDLKERASCRPFDGRRRGAENGDRSSGTG